MTDVNPSDKAITLQRNWQLADVYPSSAIKDKREQATELSWPRLDLRLYLQLNLVNVSMRENKMDKTGRVSDAEKVGESGLSFQTKYSIQHFIV